MRRAAAIAALLAALLAGTGTPRGAGGRDLPARQEAAQATYKTVVDQVRLDVVVTSGGQPVRGLTADDFEVLDNNTRQQIDLVTWNDQVSILPVLDMSGSVGGVGITELVDAVNALVGDLYPQDQVGLITFSDQVALRAPLSPARSRRAAIATALERPAVGGLTAMYDALAAGLAVAARNRGGAALLLFTDGNDTASWLTAKAVLDAVRRSDVVVYVVLAGTLSGSSLAPLESIAQASGGQVLRVESGTGGLNKTFLRILHEFRTRYVLSYSPQCVRRDDGWHSLEVRLKSVHDSVRARPGYFAVGTGGPVAGDCGPATAPAAPKLAALRPATASTMSRYAELAERYRTGDSEGASLEFGTWKARRVQEEAVPDALPQQPTVLAAAALLHAETALRQGSLEAARVHFDAALRLIQLLRDRRFDPGFRRTFCLMAESYLLWRDERHGEQFRKLASDEFPHDAEVLLALGSWNEFAATRIGTDTGPSAGTMLNTVKVAPEGSRSIGDTGSALVDGYGALKDSPGLQPIGQTTDALEKARSELQAALKLDPGLGEAYLRLGHVLLLSGHFSDATVQLERANRQTTDSFVSYLSAMFLGQLHAGAGRMEQAERWYRQALRVVPGAQSASLGLAHVLLATGRQAAAATALTELLQQPPESRSSVDPWWMYDEGQSWRMPARLAVLRKAVQ